MSQGNILEETGAYKGARILLCLLVSRPATLVRWRWVGRVTVRKPAQKALLRTSLETGKQCCLLLSVSVFSCKHLLLATVRGNELDGPLVSPSKASLGAACEQATELCCRERSGKGTLSTGGVSSFRWITSLLPQWQKGSNSDILGICTSSFSHKHTSKVLHGWLMSCSFFQTRGTILPAHKEIIEKEKAK